MTSLHLIESAVARAYSGYHRPIHRKAAAILHSVVGNHGFTDGNKRTAWLLVEILIERSGFHLSIADDAPIDDLVVSVADNQITFEELCAWFKARISKSDTAT
ncbi:type II toxin-antitoxin system death-on-curing family toxin [Yoonia sp. F2084L]|uniref:type II toxin-antitoxin system death-on-curing family toxin n=1 Tax=Yoonia sp. F2084L TaxID=2926419 RepID=UPI0032B25EC1